MFKKLILLLSVFQSDQYISLRKCHLLSDRWQFLLIFHPAML